MSRHSHDVVHIPRLSNTFNISRRQFTRQEDSSFSFQSDCVTTRNNKVLPHADNLSESKELSVHLSQRLPQFEGILFVSNVFFRKNIRGLPVLSE